MGPKVATPFSLPGCSHSPWHLLSMSSESSSHAGSLVAKSTATGGRKRSRTGLEGAKALDDGKLGRLFAEAQVTSTLKELNKRFKEDPYLACKVLHLVRQGAFENKSGQHLSGDTLPPSSNKWKLISREDLIKILSYVCEDPTFVSNINKVKGKVDVLNVLQYAISVEEGSAVFTKKMGELLKLCVERNLEVQRDLKLLEFKVDGDHLKPDFSRKGVFSLVDKDDQGVYRSVQHISGAKAPLPLDINVNDSWTLVENWVETKAKVKGSLSDIKLRQCFHANGGHAEVIIPMPLNQKYVPRAASPGASTGSFPTRLQRPPLAGGGPAGVLPTQLPGQFEEAAQEEAPPAPPGDGRADAGS